MPLSTQLVQTAEPYTLPDGAMCLTEQGWVYDALETVKIVTECSNFEELLSSMRLQYETILGDGVLTLIVKDLRPKRLNGCNIWEGWVIFAPRVIEA